MSASNLRALIAEYENRWPEESATADRFRQLLVDEGRCFDRDYWVGHITGSAWVVNPAQTHVLLTHHKKLDIWVQLGGHSDGDADTVRVAQKEAEEEGGVPVSLINEQIFDLDIHEIPARKDDPAHYHFDVRFAFRAAHGDFVVSDESHQLAWVEIADLAALTQEKSMLRMARKWRLQNAYPTKDFKR